MQSRRFRPLFTREKKLRIQVFHTFFLRLFNRENEDDASVYYVASLLFEIKLIIVVFTRERAHRCLQEQIQFRAMSWRMRQSNNNSQV